MKKFLEDNFDFHLIETNNGCQQKYALEGRLEMKRE